MFKVKHLGKYQKFTAISVRFYKRRTRSNNDMLNAMAMGNEFKLKYQMEQNIKPKEKKKDLGRTVMLSLPNTIRGWLYF